MVPVPAFAAGLSWLFPTAGLLHLSHLAHAQEPGLRVDLAPIVVEGPIVSLESRSHGPAESALSTVVGIRVDTSHKPANPARPTYEVYLPGGRTEDGGWIIMPGFPVGQLKVGMHVLALLEERPAFDERVLRLYNSASSLFIRADPGVEGGSPSVIDQSGRSVAAASCGEVHVTARDVLAPGAVASGSGRQALHQLAEPAVQQVALPWESLVQEVARCVRTTPAPPDLEAP